MHEENQQAERPLVNIQQLKQFVSEKNEKPKNEKEGNHTYIAKQQLSHRKTQLRNNNCSQRSELCEVTGTLLSSTESLLFRHVFRKFFEGKLNSEQSGQANPSFRNILSTFLGENKW